MAGAGGGVVRIASCRDERICKLYAGEFRNPGLALNLVAMQRETQGSRRPASQPGYAIALRIEAELFELLVPTLSNSWLIELAGEELPEERLALSCCKRLAPCELGESATSCDMVELTAELSPNSMAWTTVCTISLICA
jgi:hypothetical protein